MPVKVHKPTTPARRKSSVLLTPGFASTPLSRLVKGASKTAGRANGTISSRHRGGGAKRRFRTIDFRQSKPVPGVVETLEQDPFRTAFIALLKYADGDRRYVLAEGGMKVGQTVETGADASVRHGNRLPLSKIPSGTDIFNIQASAQSVSTYVRSAGTSANVVSHEDAYTQVKLPSGEVRRVPSDALATVGVVSNSEHQNVRIGKAGRNRALGRRPHVRGKAMNPVDHPHGGGEGGSPIGLKGPKTPSGLYTLGRKTRRRQRTKHIVRPRNSR